MHLRVTSLVFCLAVTAADCAWDADSHSDLITFGAGDSVARGRVLQPREIWPKRSLDNDIEFDSSRFVPPIPNDAAKIPEDAAGILAPLNASKQANEPLPSTTGTSQ